MNDNEPKRGRKATPEMNRALREFAKAAQEKGPQPSKRARMPDPGVQNKTPQERSDKASDGPAEDRVVDLYLEARERGEPLVTREQLKALKPTKH
jgi:hypothetical protein